MLVNYKIFNVKPSADYAFRDWELAKKDFNLLNDYKLVYEGTTDFKTGEVNEICETLYRTFNRVTDKDNERLEKMQYKGHSLSVSDVIYIEGENVLHYVDGCGFATIEITYNIKP